MWPSNTSGQSGERDPRTTTASVLVRGPAP